MRSMMISSSISEHSERYMSLTNDEDKVKFTLQYLSKFKHEKYLCNRQKPKSAEKATEYIEKANRNFSSRQWKSPLKTYTQAVVCAPPGSSELARAFGNRSAALYRGEMYKDSILDIERALNIGYPDETKAKLYVRKVRCLVALDREKSPRVEQALVEAREWLGKMDDANKKYMSKILNKIWINSVKKKLQEIDCYKFFPQTTNDNPKIIGASSAIEIKYSEKYGRHIVATRDIDSGETLLVHKSYATIIDPDCLLEYCWNCSRRVFSGVPCHECIIVIYCSESCRDIAWQDHHNIECPVIPAILEFDMQRRMMVLRLTVKAYKEAGTVAKLRENLEKIDAIQDPVAKSHTENIFDHTKYASVYTLLRGAECSFKETIQCMTVLYFLAAKTDILSERITSFHSLAINPSAIFLGTLILKHYDISLVSCFGTSVANDYGTAVEHSYSMKPLINLYNHSCDPTACIIGGAGVSATVTLERIRKDEQIFIDYGPVFWEDPINERRRRLARYRFICECRACVGNWGPHSYFSFPSYKLSSPDFEFISFTISRGLSDISAVRMSISELHSLITKVSNLINILQRATDYPTRQLIDFKQFLVPLYTHVSSKWILNSA